jgi:hypothetical protein
MTNETEQTKDQSDPWEYREFKHERWDIEFGINHDKFGSKKATDFSDSAKEKKYNLKVNDADIEVMDLLCKQIGISRNTLITLLLERILQKWLFEIEDLDTRLLLARYADKLSNSTFSDTATSWCNKILKDYTEKEVERVFDFYRNDNNLIFLEWMKADKLRKQLKEAKAAGDLQKADELNDQIFRLSHSDSYVVILKKITEK